MKSVVHRVRVNAGTTIVELPRGATLIHAAWKAGEPCPSLWYVFDAANRLDLERRRFELIGTGHELATDGSTPVTHAGSFIAPDGFHVFHVFEVAP